MNIKYIFTILTVVLLAGITGCDNVDSKEKYLDEYEAFIAEIKENKKSYSEDEWKQKDKEFQRFSKDLYEKYQDELGFFEQTRIAKYALSYATNRGTSALNNVLESGELDEAVNEISNIFDKEVQGDLEKAVNDLKEVWDDDLKEELGGKLEELKDKLEDEEFQKEMSDKMEELKAIVEDKETQGKLKDAMKELEEVLKDIEKKVEEKKE